MGDWGPLAWDSDEGADWFHRFWQGGGMQLVVDELRDFDPAQGRWDSLRAACHVLIAFASPYAWPSHLEDALRLQAMADAVRILGHMLQPPTTDWTFIDDAEADPLALADVRRQLAQLQALLATQAPGAP